MLRVAIIVCLFGVLRLVGLDAPPIAREMRGVWVASVGNIDWPTHPGAPPAAQQEELRALLDGFARIHMNTVIFQVRPACDALYESKLEPWSEYLTGRMGVGPTSPWDPLKFAITEAHARGMELHAWFNPFRARYHEQISPVSPKHISVVHPEMVVAYGRYQWLDPGLASARKHSLDVIRDVVNRYDIDGVHIDDYFYPYPVEALGVRTPFPDDASYNAYRREGGKLARNDWRRENINGFIRQLNDMIHLEKPWVKFGVSPFGIWRPGYPASVKGLDAYDILYADSRHWLTNGLCDYFTPQLYWNLSAPNQSFSSLLSWWREQNTKARILAPGLATASIGKDREAQEILSQIAYARSGGSTNGVLFWNASSIRDNKGGLTMRLAREAFAEPALPPSYPWLDPQAPDAPALTVDAASPRGGMTFRWTQPTGNDAYAYVVQARFGSHWRWEKLPGTNKTYTFSGLETGVPSAARIIPLNRAGVEGTPAEWQRPGRQFPTR